LKAADLKAEEDRLRKDFWFHYPFRVRYAEVDAQSVVFNAHYLTYFDTAITEYFRTIGYDYYGEVTRTGIDFHAVRSLVEYKAPIRFDEEIEVCVRVAICATSLKAEKRAYSDLNEIVGTTNSSIESGRGGRYARNHRSRDRFGCSVRTDLVGSSNLPWPRDSFLVLRRLSRRLVSPEPASRSDPHTRGKRRHGPLLALQNARQLVKNR
jgi:YbgC/YbaW family acyl-CoA thioester hydrolase